MRSTLSFVALALCAHALPASAKSAAATEPDPESSSAIRANESYGIAAAYGSPGAGTLMPGAQAYYVLSSQWVFTAAYFQAQMSITPPSSTSADGSLKSDGGSVELNVRSFNIGARRFFGNSFYAQGNLGTNWYRANLKVDAVDTSSGASVSSYDSTITAQTVYAHIGIGNMWSFDNGLFIDCQWIGYAQPLAGGYTYSGTATGAAQNSVLAQSSDDLGHTLTKNGNISALVAFGWAY